MTRAGKLIAAAAAVAVLQVGFLSWMIAGRAAVLRDGKEVLLKVQPIDPRDLLRGDYVRLGYDISRLPASVFVPPPAEQSDYRDRPVWVLLKPGADGVYQAANAATDREALPEAGADGVVIHGSINQAPGLDGEAWATYGIERFYLPEGEGKPIERDMRERPFFVVAAVAEDGAAQIKRFLDGDKVLYEEPFY